MDKEKRGLSVNDLDLMERHLWGKIFFSNAEKIAKEMGIKSVEKIETVLEGGWTVRFYLVRKNDGSVGLVEYKNVIIMNGNMISPKSLGKQYTLNVWDTLIFEDWNKKVERKIKENLLILSREVGISTIGYERLMWYFLSWKWEIKKKSKLIVNMWNKK